MSTGTNKERITQNNGIINENNADLTALKTRINNLPTSGDTTATASDIALGKTAVSKGVKITGTYTPPTVSLQSKDVTINQNGTTTITADTGYDGLSDVDVTVSGILDTSDATATANDIVKNKTAYVNGIKITGTSEPDWSQIGYTNGVPDALITDFNYAKSLYDNWDNTETDLTDKFATGQVYNFPLSIAPNVDTSNGTIFKNFFGRQKFLRFVENYNTQNAIDMEGMFKGCQGIKQIPQLDTSNVTTMSFMFNSCGNIITIPQLDTSKVTNMQSMFEDCRSLVTIPALNTQHVLNTNSMFSKCNELQNVPILNMQSVINMSGMFGKCPSLSNESLNNILYMCANATAYINQGTNMTLRYVGLASTQATTCQTLSNWDAFVAARLVHRILIMLVKKYIYKPNNM